MFDPVDWAGVFHIDTPLIEIFVRGTLIYLGLFVMLRFIMNRQTGGVSVTDVLVIVLIADAAQNGMSGDYKSIPDGLLLVATIIFWDFVLDWLSYRFSWFGRLVNPKEVPLIRAGKVLKKNLAREMMTLDELKSHLREKGVDDLAHVKKACMESGGEISVVTYGLRKAPRRKRTPGGA